MKKTLYFLLLLLLSSCNVTHYYLHSTDRLNSLDFSKGTWLIGDIEVDQNTKTKLTRFVMADFSKYLGRRLKYSMSERKELAMKQIPLKLEKSAILDLKKGADADYYVNIKCKNAKNEFSNFEFKNHFYYKKQMTYAEVILEVYDLNKGEIIYSKAAGGCLEEELSITNQPTTVVIMGCYKKIINDIKKIAIKPEKRLPTYQEKKNFKS
ncbi:hypothetical protein [Flavobacterium hydrophilum]|uniref:hypothetical protein n=1 Tax=Flavobacterium hydrophilum TaxID=2211445 RepID=UPI000F4E5652|nr:hypothetical protein [Flavobacterium hydrophilum]